METKIQVKNQNSTLEGENEMEMANEAYTKELLNDLIHLLDIKTEYEIKDGGLEYSVIFCSDEGNRNIQVDLELELNVEKSYGYNQRHPDKVIDNITGFDFSIIGMQTSSAAEAEFLLMQYQDAIKVVKMFKKIADSNAVLIENL